MKRLPPGYAANSDLVRMWMTHVLACSKNKHVCTFAASAGGVEPDTSDYVFLSLVFVLPCLMTRK